MKWVCGLAGRTLPPVRPSTTPKDSSYSRFQKGPFNHPDAYPIQQSVDATHYRPIAAWMGRLILPHPEERGDEDGVWFEVHHTDADHTHLVGQTVWLAWQDKPWVKDYLKLVTRDLHFSASADYSLRQGKVVPARMNGWRLVGPLESLAGARPTDNMTVMLNGPVQVEESSHPEVVARVLINQEPAEISGRFYALAQFIAPIQTTPDGILYRIRHYNKATRQFDGPEDEVFVPQVEPNINGLRPSSNQNLEQSPCNGGGWYPLRRKKPGPDS